MVSNGSYGRANAARYFSVRICTNCREIPSGNSRIASGFRSSDQLTHRGVNRWCTTVDSGRSVLSYRRPRCREVRRLHGCVRCRFCSCHYVSGGIIYRSGLTGNPLGNALRSCCTGLLRLSVVHRRVKGCLRSVRHRGGRHVNRTRIGDNPVRNQEIPCGANLRGVHPRHKFLHQLHVDLLGGTGKLASALIHSGSDRCRNLNAALSRFIDLSLQCRSLLL